MAATVQINHYYGSVTPLTKQANVSRHDWLSNREVAQTSDLRSTYPVDVEDPGPNFSFETWNTFEVTAMGGSSAINTLRMYTSAAPGTGLSLFTNARTSGQGGPANQTSEVAPSDSDSTLAIQAMPTSDPGETTITCSLTAAGESTYVVSQLEVASTATTGFELTVTYKYAEVA